MSGKMKFLVGLCVIGFSCIASAEKSFSKFSAHPLNVQDMPEQYLKAYQAKFRMKDDQGSACTGTYISNEGHGLTAAHCVSRCMPFPGRQGLKYWPILFEENGVQSQRKVTANTWSYPQLCSVTIDGVETRIELLSGSKGELSEQLPTEVMMYFRQYNSMPKGAKDEYMEHWMKSFYEGWGLGGDFAIFKRLDEKPIKTSCLKISKAESFSGDHYMLAYPGLTSVSATRRNYDLYLSTGSVIAGNYFNSGLVRIEDTSGRYLYSTLSAYMGSSGGGLVNSENDEVSGVLSVIGAGEGMTKDDLPTARYVSAKVIREVSGQVMDEITCEN